MVAKHKITRRQAIYWGAALGGGLLLPLTYTGRRNEYKLWAKDSEKDGRFFGYTPFTQPLFIPARLTALDFGTLQPTPQAISNRGPRRPTGDPNDVTAGIAPEFGECDDWNRFSTKTHEKEYQLNIVETTQRFVPGGPDTPT